MNNAEVLIKFKADDKEAQKTTKSVQKSLESVSKSTAKYSAVATGVIAGISAVSMEFEKSMANVQAISGATADDMALLEAKAREMGKETVFSASESADALSYMALAGWKTQDMLDGLPGILNLAAAGNTDLATTSDIVTDALTAFGKTAKDSARLADIMSATMSNSNTNIEMLGQSFKYVASLAGAMNYTMEDTSLALGLMANSGIKADQAGTSLRMMFTRLASPPNACAGAMKELGISLTNTDGTMKSMREVIQNLRTAFKGLNEEQKAEYASAIAGKNALSGMLALVNGSDEDFDKLANAIDNSTGSAQQMSDVMNQSTSNQLKIMWSEIQELALKMGEILVPTIRKTIAMFTKIAQALQNMSPEMRQFIIIVLEIVAALAPVTMIIAKVIQAFTMLGKAMTFLKAIGLINPFTLIIAGVIALVAGFVYLWKHCEAFRNFWINLWANIKKGLAKAGDWINNKIKSIGDFFSGVGEAIKTGFVTAITAIGDFIVNTITGIITFIMNIPTMVMNLITSIFTFINQIPYMLGFVIGYIIGSIYKFFHETIPAMWQWLWTQILNAIEFIKTLPSAIGKILASIGTFLANAWQNFVAWLGNVIEIIKALPGQIWAIIVNFFTTMWEKTVAFFDKIRNGLIDFIKNAKDKIIEFKDNIIDFFKELPGKMLDIGKNIVEGLWNGIKNMKEWMKNKVGEFAKGILDGMKSALGIHSPSKEFAILGKFSVLGYTEALDDMQSEVDNAINDTFGISPQLQNSSALHYSPNVVVNNDINVSQDPLGQMVSNIKSFSGGAKNDYSFGLGE